MKVAILKMVQLICIGVIGVSLIGLAYLTPLPEGLYLLYFMYSAAIVVFLHAAFFHLNLVLKKRESAQRRNVPRYLEYAYALVLSVSLLQVFISARHVASYVSYMSSGEDQVLKTIRDEARSANIKCIQNGGKPIQYMYFWQRPVETCDELRLLATAPDLRSYLNGEIKKDPQYVEHFVGKYPNLLEPPLAFGLNSYRANIVYSGTSVDPTLIGAFAWLALLLLPLAIGLRVTKTSLELFGNL